MTKYWILIFIVLSMFVRRYLSLKIPLGVYTTSLTSCL